MEAVSDAQKEIFEGMGFKQMVSDFTELYDMLSDSPDYKRKMRKQHQERGAFRSGEGTPE
jgi:hypothetical protein